MGVTRGPATDDELARIQSEYNQHHATPSAGLEELMERMDLMPEHRPLLKLAKLWEAMRPADKAAVALEVARMSGNAVDADDIDIGMAARAAAQLIKPDKRKLARDVGFDHAVTVATRIWVIDRGNKYEVGHFHRNSKYNKPYPMQAFIADAVSRALPAEAISRRALVNKPGRIDILRIVDSSIRLHDDKLRRSRRP
jgi:hypothetical protein